MAGSVVLSVQALSHSFGPSEVLENIDLDLRSGETLALVGPSGCGKTTLLRLCAGLLDRQSGDIHNGFLRPSFAFQDPRLLPWLSTLDNIALGLKASGHKRRQRRDEAIELAATLGLTRDDLEKFPKDLSGGMRQRAAFARALLINPDLMFLDEPFSALDIGLKRELQQLLVRKVREQGLALFFITHDLMEAVRLGQRILLLDGVPGRIRAEFIIDKTLDERDDAFVYRKTADLLAEPTIIETFELAS